MYVSLVISVTCRWVSCGPLPPSCYPSISLRYHWQRCVRPQVCTNTFPSAIFHPCGWRIWQIPVTRVSHVIAPFHFSTLQPSQFHFSTLYSLLVVFWFCSGKIHSNVKQRWLQGMILIMAQFKKARVQTICVCSGDHEVIEAMQKFAELTDKAKYALFFSEVCYDQNLYAGLLLKARIMRGQRTN